MQRRTLEEVQQIYHEYQGSGLSRKEFCAQKGIKYDTFQMWVHNRLARGTPLEPQFVKVSLPTHTTATGGAMHSPSASYEIQILSRRLTIPTGFVAREVKQLIEFLSC